jgi:translation initiation factor IF-2
MPRFARSRKRIISLGFPPSALEDGKVESLNLIIKGDVSGATEAPGESLVSRSRWTTAQLRIIHRVSVITESDASTGDDRQCDHHRVQRAP